MKDMGTVPYFSVHYKGQLLDGTEFDSSYKRKQPIDFAIGVGQVIAGWDEGIQLLKVGDKARMVIPSNLAYGSRGAGGVIPPDAPLIFDVELIDVKQHPICYNKLFGVYNNEFSSRKLRIKTRPNPCYCSS